VQVGGPHRQHIPILQPGQTGQGNTVERGGGAERKRRRLPDVVAYPLQDQVSGRRLRVHQTQIASSIDADDKAIMDIDGATGGETKTRHKRKQEGDAAKIVHHEGWACQR
jgi:hypothetical protein